MDTLFEKLGLNPKETAAFLELVRLGPSPISLWAKHAGVKRSSMYVILERLLKFELVTTFIHRGIQHVQTVPVTELSALLNDKEASLIQARSLLTEQLPELQKLERSFKITPKVQFYEGVHRVEAMYEEVLKEKSFKAYFHPGRVKKHMPAYFHKIPQTLKARNGKAQELLVSCAEAEEYMSTYRSEKHQISLLPKNTNFSSDTIITDSKIFLVGYGDTEIVGTGIWNEELAKTQSTIFDIAWINLTRV